MRSSAEIAPSRSPIWVARLAKRNSTSRSAGLRIVSWKASSYCCLTADALGLEEGDAAEGAWAKAGLLAAREPTAIRAAHKAGQGRCGNAPTAHASPRRSSFEQIRPVPALMLR